MFSKSLLVVLISCLLRQSWSRYISLSLNLSMGLSDDRPTLTVDALRDCMKETEISMAELNTFRLSLLTNDGDIVDSLEEAAAGGSFTKSTDDNGQFNVVDYDGAVSSMVFSERNDQSLQCFAHCLYEQLGLVKNGIFIENDFLPKLYSVIEHEKDQIKECMNLESENKCELVYKVHLCYSRLKALDAERRIREILEYGENENVEADELDGETDGEPIAGDAAREEQSTQIKKNEI